MSINLNKFKSLPLHWQVVISVIPSILIVALFVYLIYIPKGKEMAKLNARVASLDAEIEKSVSMINRLDSLIKENKMLKAKLKKLKDQLPEGKEVSVLLKQISELGLKSGLEIMLWKPEAKKTDPQGLYVEIPVKVQVVAEYHKLGEFFSHISRLPRLVNISDLDLNIKQKNQDDGQSFIDANFRARTFASAGQAQQPAVKAKK